jgi:hypothetical protein
MLASNEAKPVRERLTLIRIFEALRGVGYEGGYRHQALAAGEKASLLAVLGLQGKSFVQRPWGMPCEGRSLHGAVATA